MFRNLILLTNWSTHSNSFSQITVHFAFNLTTNGEMGNVSGRPGKVQLQFKISNWSTRLVLLEFSALICDFRPIKGQHFDQPVMKRPTSYSCLRSRAKLNFFTFQQLLIRLLFFSLFIQLSPNVINSKPVNKFNVSCTQTCNQAPTVGSRPSHIRRIFKTKTLQPSSNERPSLPWSLFCLLRNK